MTDVRQCKTCTYWTNLYGGSSGKVAKACHHILATNKQRVEVDGVCQSYKKRGDSK